ncbi:Hypothetical protein (Fragment) [Durusdinium trenchii]|uniref:Protein HGH1 N-terminal domain-containing protein n=1 Tax=Durusdinium trenchii TaxID=1381693 RepID=A0ABP0QR04_9DINO
MRWTVGSLGVLWAAWVTAETPSEATEQRRLQIFDPFVTSTFPVGTGITVHLSGSKTASGVDSGQLDLLVGEVLFGLSLDLPLGYYFNVHQARVRIVFAYLTQNEARSGECAPDQLGPVSDQVVQAPLSSRYGAPAEQGLGTSSLQVMLSGGATFVQDGDYRLCFSDDGSFASGHADLLNVLIRVQAYVTSRLPAGSGLTVFFENGQMQSAEDGESIILSAGQPITGISLHLPLLSIFDASSLRLKAINASVTRDEAVDGACAAGSAWELPTEVVDVPLSASLGVETLHSQAAEGGRERQGTRFANTSLSVPIHFNSAGQARLCYSDDGSFSTNHVDLISVLITAEGIFSSCEVAGCQAARTFRCYALLGISAEVGSCVLPIEGVGYSSSGYVSWSAQVDALYSGNGEPLPFDVPRCGQFPADPGAFCVGDCAGNRSFPLSSSNSVTMPPSGPLTASRDARTTAVCYCTDVVGCHSGEERGVAVSTAGLVQLFTASVMPIGEFACTTSSSGVLASIPFGACVFCPPGGCPFEGAARILFARQPEPWNTQTLPAWHPQHRCRHAVHESFLLPAAAEASQLDGGPRSELKRFRPTEGYTLPNWPTFVPRGNWLDICFNPDINSDPSGWFKVGEVAVLDASLASSSTVPSHSASPPPKQVGQMGQISMSRSLLPYRNPSNVVGLNVGGGIRLATLVITEDSSTREACQKSRPTEVNGLTRADASAYGGTVRGERVVFDGGEVGKSISFPTVATVVVCYCPNLGGLDEFGEQVCLGSPYWVPVGAIVIAGPLPNQYWLLPTMKIFRFEYLGVNLEDGDMLRLVLESQSCSAFTTPERMCLQPNEDPMNGHPLCGSTRLTANSGLMRTTTLASTRIACDELNGNCQSVPLSSVETTSTGLRLTFAGSTSSGGGLGELGLRSGDVLVLGAGVQCGANCSQPMLDMAKGFLGFQGLESYLPLDDGSLQTALDVVGSRTASYIGSVESITGKFGTATRFSAGSSLSLPGGAPMEASQAWTLVLWVRIEKAGWYTICGVADSDGVLENGEVEIGLASAPWAEGAPFLRQEGGPGAGEQVATGMETGPFKRFKLAITGSVSSGVWTHVAVVYGGSMSGTLRFYLEGALVYERLDVNLNLASLPLQCAGRVSAFEGHSGNASDGYMDLDEIRWYNVPLSSEDVAALFNAADGGVLDAQQAPGAPIGIAVEATENPSVFTVQQGSFAAAPVPPQFITSGGQWRRSNRGVIRGELMSSMERRLKLCWERGNRAADAGIVEFVAQSSMTELGIWPTQREWSKSSPFILTFKTGSAEATPGIRYTQAEGHMSLSITYLNQAAIRHMGSSAQGPFVSSFNLESDEWDEASQSTCGIIFRELWSSDPARGFPLPLGCFYRSLTTDMREIVVIFEKRNGLSPDTSYQIVMNAATTNEMVANQEDQKPEVRRFAAETVLSQTEDPDFLDFCKREPRRCARPLLRLAEKAEQDSAEAAAAAGGYSSGQEMKSEKVAAIQAASNLAAGVHALKCLVNLSAVPAVAEELVSLNAPKRLTEALRAGWLEGRAQMAHWYSMLLANVSTCKKGQEALCADEGMLKFLVAAYLTTPRLPARDGYEDPLLWLGAVLVNVLVLPEGRKLLAIGKSQELEMLFGEMSDRSRRADMVNAAKNVCLDMDCHEALVATDLMLHMARFLCPWDTMDTEHRSALPSVLRESLEKEGAALTGAGNNDPQFAVDVGLEIVGGDETTNLVTLQDGSTRLQLQMMGGQYSTAKISRGNLLSIWLEPLTAWQLPTSCGDRTDLSVEAGSMRIHCFVIFGTFRRCGEVVNCAGKPVVPFATQIPWIEVEMPPNMNDLFGPLIYEMDIYSLKLPSSGALPHRLMVQIMKDDSTKPHFRVATGRFYNAPTREFATIGRVLTSPQNGLEPFEGVPTHVLYVMLQLAVPLRGFDRTQPPPNVRPDSSFVIQAPPGFRMLEAVPVIHEGSGLGKVTLSDEGDAVSRLNETRQPAPTGFGTPDLSGWSFLGREATYKLLDRSLIPAMTSLVMGLRVYPGNTSLPITNTLNLWSVQVFSPGDHNDTVVNFSAKFYRTGLGGVPVLGRLQNALIQPVDPMVSSAVPIIQPLSIFFRAVEDVPAGGSVDVEDCVTLAGKAILSRQPWTAETAVKWLAADGEICPLHQCLHCPQLTLRFVQDGEMPAISSSVMAMISAPPLRWLFWKKTGEELEKGLEKVQAVYGQDGAGKQFSYLLWAFGFGCIRCGFTFFERGKAYTSLAQFLGNLVYMPVLLDWYGHFLGDSPRLYVFLFPVNIWLLEIAQGLAIQWIFGQNVAWCYADYADELLTFIRLGHAICSFPTRKAASVFDFGDPCAAIDLDAGLGDSEIGRLKGG